ncbi:hypothetical protein WR164_10900 [Philodulcilactobacillus myokoensis]|uniref:Uncharacterized protein n=1 Tax=Philodulcilactobacillus myokoensis TaxID=2929573 RepID=A0A9W6B1L3_9LACO|nr:hypothetical protein [Philodulcilactobacillus myokoensis]GLB47111.1 hypothetical protein WR164_10900 [Philodulcilactobacillus myokoensis]
MKYTKRHRVNRKQQQSRRDATWKKFKDQQNELNADRRGVKNKY